MDGDWYIFAGMSSYGGYDIIKDNVIELLLYYQFDREICKDAMKSRELNENSHPENEGILRVLWFHGDGSDVSYLPEIEIGYPI